MAEKEPIIALVRGRFGYYLQSRTRNAVDPSPAQMLVRIRFAQAAKATRGKPREEGVKAISEEMRGFRAPEELKRKRLRVWEEELLEWASDRIEMPPEVLEKRLEDLRRSVRSLVLEVRER